jgi:proton-translocating NADH-quinone oxidoreductase chain L
MFNIDTLMVLIPALPLAAALVTAALGKPLLRERSHVPVVAAVGVACLLSLVLLFRVAGESAQAAAKQSAAQSAGAASSAGSTAKGVGYERVRNLWTWALVADAYAPLDGRAGTSLDEHATAARIPNKVDFKIDIALRADPLTAIMLAMVTFVSLLVVIYAIGYMHGDPGYWRFFTYLALFVFSMTMLVSSSNFLLLYVFWEAVGLCSYLLIGFWYEKPAAAAAGMKAFLVNRVGDFGFALGVFLLWTTYGTLNFHDTPGHDGTLIRGILGQSLLASPGDYVGGNIGLAIALLLFLGACGKSAQFPLHVWLPDAMEGPTPVSALIHAATMVTAGVYMVTRCLPLYLAAPRSLLVVASIGGFTAMFAGLIAITQTDLKRVLAYSTVSQLGYMFLGLGTGTLAGVTAGMFHLLTHAFFKALLFLSAGSVMHAMAGIVDMRRFGGLRHVMPWTHRAFWCGGLALAGVVPFSGFWSKDAIIAAAGDNAHGENGTLYLVLFYMAMFAALLTSLYTFRALFLTFFGPQRVPAEAGHHAHESPPVMVVPMIILSVFALGVGGFFEYTHGFANLLARTPSLSYSTILLADGVGGAAAHAEHFHWGVATVSTMLALLGLGLAAYLYLGDRREVEALARFMQSPWGLRLYQLSSGKFYIDQIYMVCVVWPLRLVAALANLFDRYVIDELVNFVGRVPPAIGSVLRWLQTGMVQFYALGMVLGLLVLIAALLMWTT